MKKRRKRYTEKSKDFKAKRRKRVLTNEMIADIASKYEHRSDFMRGDNSVYVVARRRGILDEICSHMTPLGNAFQRKIYVFTFSDGYAYVGLAQNPQKRYQAHLAGYKESSVYKHIKETNASFEYKILSEWLPKEVAGQVEEYYIEQYKADGWKMLNKVRGGSLGNPTLFYTENRLTLEAVKYDYVEDFMEGSPNYYKYIVSHGLVNKYCAHMKRRKIWRWTLEKAIEVASECKYRTELRKSYYGAYEKLKKEGLLDKYFPCVKKQKKKRKTRKIVTLEESIAIASQCESRYQLQKKSTAAYKRLYKEGLLDEYLPSKRKRPRTEEEYMENLQKCKSRTELQDKYKTTYRWAKKNGLLDKYLPINKMTDEERMAVINKCKSRNELRKSSFGVYEWAKNSGLLDKCFPLKNYTDDEKLAILKSYKSRSKLRNKELTVYRWAEKKGLLDVYIPVNRRTDEERIAIIKGCKSRYDLHRKYGGVYEWAAKNGLLDEYYPIDIPSDEEREAIIRKYKTRNELFKNDRRTYSWASKNGLLDKYFPNKKHG